MEQKDINEDEAIAIAKDLIHRHVQSKKDEYAEFFRLDCKSEPEPTFFEIEQAAGEIPTDKALYLDNED